MDPHSATCSPTAQPHHISSLRNPGVTPCPILTHHPQVLPGEQTQDSLIRRKKNSAGGHWCVFHCSAPLSPNLSVCTKLQGVFFQGNKLSKSWKNEKQHLGRRWGKSNSRQHTGFSLRFLKGRKNTVALSSLSMQAQQTQFRQADSYVKSANVQVHPRVSLWENVKTSNTHHSKYCLQELLSSWAMKSLSAEPAVVIWQGNSINSSSW